MRVGRKAKAADMTDTDTVENTENTEATGRKGGKRAPLDVGTVTIRPSEDQSSKGRVTRMDTDPVAVAVRDAERDVWLEIEAEDESKVPGIKSLLRRAGQHYGVGMHIDPRDLGAKVRFKVGERRQRKNKDAETEAQPEQWAGPTTENPEAVEQNDAHVEGEPAYSY